MACIPQDWRNPETHVYEINFVLRTRKNVGCKLIGIPVGDWMVLNLLPKGASSRCKTRAITVHVLKYVNMHQKTLGKFWHLKELALKYLIAHIN